ncbi:MAG: hypothetical protein ACEPOW_13900 [Bacteroidales bacterium]
MRFLLTTIMIVCVLNVYSQSLKKKIPNKFGVTHHFIAEDKINLMKDANLAQDLIDKYKTNITIGYAETAIGVGGLVFAGCFMDVPQWWSDGRRDSKARRRRNLRYGASAIGAAFVIDGVIRIGRNHKKLRKIQVTLQPTTGGVRFYF